MSEVTISIPKDKFNFLINTIDSHRDFLNKIKMPDIVRQSAVRDIHIIRSIVTTSRKVESHG